MIPKFFYRHNLSRQNSYRRDGANIHRGIYILALIVVAYMPSAAQVYAQEPQEKQPATEEIAQANNTAGDAAVLNGSGSNTETIANRPTAVKTKIANTETNGPDKSGSVKDVGKVQRDQDDSATVSPPAPPVSPPASPPVPPRTTTIDSTSSTIHDKVTDAKTTSSLSNTGKNTRSNTSASKLESRPLPPDPRKAKKATQTNAISQKGISDTAQSLPGVSSLKSINAPDWILKTLGALGAVIGLILLVRPLLKRLAGPLGTARAPSGVIEALARYPFGKGQSLVLLKLDSRILLLSQTSQGSNLITEMTDPDDVASILRRVHDEKGESFNRKLEELLHGSGGNDAVSGHHSGVRDDSNASGIVDLTSEGTGRSWWMRIAGSRG